MTAILAAQVGDLPDGYAVVVENNRWRRLWAIMCIGSTLTAIGGAVVAVVASTSVECGRRGSCADDQVLAALPWIIAGGGSLFWAAVLFGVWWACRRYRVIIRSADLAT